MTVYKACGGEISFAHLEQHVCPKPNAAYEAERDQYCKFEAERRTRDERLGIYHRLVIDAGKNGWSERFPSSVIARYRFREFDDEAAARACAEELRGKSGTQSSARP